MTNSADQEPEEPNAWEQFLQQYEWKQLLRHHPELGRVEDKRDDR